MCHDMNKLEKHCAQGKTEARCRDPTMYDTVQMNVQKKQIWEDRGRQITACLEQEQENRLTVKGHEGLLQFNENVLKLT